MKRALMYASVASMIQQFNMENIRLLLEQGYEVDVACNMEQGSTITQEKIENMKQELEEMGVNVFHIPIPRKVTAVGGIVKSFRASKRLINGGSYSLIHCHSPIGGMICRLANRCSKGYGKTKMIYTAHGFHFYKGAPKKNWLMFYPVEWFCSRYTDVLITINQEDYALAKSKMKAKRVEYVPGVGIDIERIMGIEEKRDALCEECEIDSNSVLMVSVGELNENKNHRAVLVVLDRLPEDYHYLICGQGVSRPILEALAREHGCEDRLHILGYRDDVLSIVKSCDLFVFPSKREGLSVALMEAMACGIPCIASDIRGNCDLVDDGEGGMLLKAEAFGRELVERLKRIDDISVYKRNCGQINMQKVNMFSMEIIVKSMAEIYGRS